MTSPAFQNTIFPRSTPARIVSSKSSSYLGISCLRRPLLRFFPTTGSNGVLLHCCAAPDSQTTPQQQELKVQDEIDDSPVSPNQFQFQAPESPISMEDTSATVQAVLDDVVDRPEYYLNVGGVLVGLMLSIVVLSAVMLALDSIPLASDTLRVIGLAYVFWFLNKFLFSASERQRLGSEIDEFVAGVRGGQSMKMDDVADS